ncbi:thermitase, putative [Perkinsus marinus ATCC 50983]|uniref:subtilisin n=1 Tax=Perkinsus marinus (strain ATCC 50983 / TXsc) TaxID=423536 RepID=C5L7I9_PERM5|nr:thermitase, putative [Perkinsus marinus ATCC 50983]EER07451.1 thermitase, putative [Perkinsus marinus ATCC 50983]|eukprot:XP_002775635.1 thermitase, putative [Perkinsus marinus ATCC 50983]
MATFYFVPYGLIYVVVAVVGSDHFRGIDPVNGDPNDKYYPHQKAYLEAISVPKAWNILDSTSKRTPVTIAVIDDGVQADHPDLQGVVTEGYNVIDKNADTHPRGPHGTMMAGILGAIRNNKIGIAGIADHLRVMPIYVGDKASSRAMTDAFTYLISKRPDVKVIVCGQGSKTYYQSELKKILEAVSAGMLVVVVAGNDHLDLDIEEYFPCSLRGPYSDGVICVAATNGTRMQLDDESNFGSAVDVAAPGYQILGTTPTGTYSKGTGTCGATGIIAGIAGMLYSLEPSQHAKLTPAYIRNIIKNTATRGVIDSKGEKFLTFGRVNAEAAVREVLKK